MSDLIAMIGVGSGWWSVGGQIADIVGFLILTADVYPEFRATKVRRLARQFLIQTRQAIEAVVLNKSTLVPDFLWPVLDAEGIEARSLSSTRIGTMNAPHISGAMTQEQREALATLKNQLAALEFAHRDSHTHADGSWRPDLTLDKARSLESIVPVSPRLATLAQRISKVANKPLMLTADYWLPVGSQPKLLELLEMVNNIVDMMDTAEGSRFRIPLTYAVILIVAGFAAQVVGSLPKDDFVNWLALLN